MSWENAYHMIMKIGNVVAGTCYIVYLTSTICSFTYIFCKYKRKERQSWITLFLITALCNLILLALNAILQKLDIWHFKTGVSESNTKWENFYNTLLQIFYAAAAWLFISQYFKVALYIPILRTDNISRRLEQIRSRRSLRYMLNAGATMGIVSLSLIAIFLPSQETIFAFYAIPLLANLALLLYSWVTIRREIRARRIESLFATEKIMKIIVILCSLTTIFQIGEQLLHFAVTEENKFKVYFFNECFVIFDHLLDTFFAIMLFYLTIKFTQPYTIEQHASFMLVISQDLNVITKAITNAERMAAAERLLQACREDADRTMVHLLAQMREPEGSSVKLPKRERSTFTDASLYDYVKQFKQQYQQDTENTS